VNLRYLTTEQTLADIARFLESFGTSMNVVVGGSYPGALAAWFKTSYPHLAVAAWASSAVVRTQAELPQLDEHVYEVTL
jgi:pimeloyl-ACP methyl ester carboxylesterase